jgi:glutaredoxin-like protein
MLNDEVAEQLRTEFTKLVKPVRLVVFSQALADPGSEQARRLVEEVGALDPRLSVECLNFILDKERGEALGIQRIPAIAILGEDKDYGIRMYGMPSGYEFGSLIDAILDVSGGVSGLAEETVAALQTLTHSVHVQVFSTPTCPYCPLAVRMAFRFAMASDKITADGIEVTGYPELAQRYRVSSVPKTVVGEEVEFVGAGPEAMLLEHVLKAGRNAD